MPPPIFNFKLEKFCIFSLVLAKISVLRNFSNFRAQEAPKTPPIFLDPGSDMPVAHTKVAGPIPEIVVDSVA